jgi:DNA-binding NtrC family response regulator
MRLADDARTLLRRQPWVGNVRQLLSVVRRAAARSDDAVIAHSAITAELRREYGIDGREEPSIQAAVVDDSLEATIEHVRRRQIDLALKEAHGNISEAARNLGYATKEGLKHWLSKFGIDPKRYVP